MMSDLSDVLDLQLVSYITVIILEIHLLIFFGKMSIAIILILLSEFK